MWGVTASYPHLTDVRSVERSCRYLYGLRAFSLVEHLIPDSKDAPGFWPGDDVEASVLESEEYKQVSKGRMEKLRDLECDQTVGYKNAGCLIANIHGS